MSRLGVDVVRLPSDMEGDSPNSCLYSTAKRPSSVKPQCEAASVIKVVS
jgi:hypothetical protein